MNLHQRIEGYVSRFLDRQAWSQSLNKNQLRERLRKNLTDSGMIKYGVDHLVDTSINSKSKSSFYPQIDELVTETLGLNEPEEEEEVEAENGDDSKMNVDDDVDNSQLSSSNQVGNDDRQSVDMDVDDSNESTKKVGGFIQTFKEIEAPQMSPGYTLPVASDAIAEEHNSTDANLPPSDSNYQPEVGTSTEPPVTPCFSTCSSSGSKDTPKKFTMQLNLSDTKLTTVTQIEQLKFEQPVVRLDESSIPENMMSELEKQKTDSTKATDSIKKVTDVDKQDSLDNKSVQHQAVVKIKTEKVKSRSQSPSEQLVASKTSDTQDQPKEKERKTSKEIERIRSREKSQSPNEMTSKHKTSNKKSAIGAKQEQLKALEKRSASTEKEQKKDLSLKESDVSIKQELIASVESKATKKQEPLKKDHRQQQQNEKSKHASSSSEPDKKNIDKSRNKSSDATRKSKSTTSSALPTNQTKKSIPPPPPLSRKPGTMDQPKSSIPIEKPPLKPSKVSKTEDELSDVSSVHTSDLSDFDGNISVSSGDDEKRKKLTVQEVKKLAEEKKNKAKKMTSRGGRQRKANTRYTGGDYAAGDSSSDSDRPYIHEAVEEDEVQRSPFQDPTDMDIESPVQEEEQPPPPPPPPPLISSGRRNRDKKETQPPPLAAAPSPAPPPVDKAATKKQARRAQQQQQRYDASDLYKPRPSVGSSRRNRGTSNASENQP